MKSNYLTDAQVEEEIAHLQASELVRRASRWKCFAALKISVTNRADAA